MNGNDNIKEFTIQELFEKMDNYVIPIYQRNYAWSDEEVKQMIKDIQEYCKTNNDKRYYLGALTVKKRADNAFEVIDGQQRLTTLFLILSVLNYSFKLNLSFEHRQNSSDEFNIIKKQGELNNNSQIAVIYNYLQKQAFSDNFLSALLNKVQIIRTEIPENTDLNQYFERMNNRGEQLEHHEVIKAKLMGKLDQADQAVFSAIWNACSDMNRYAVSSFSSDERKALFESGGEYFRLYENFGNIKNKFPEAQKSQNSDDKQPNDEPKKLSEILKPSTVQPINEKSVKQSERFTSIIDFPNFLAQVLYLFLKDNHEISDDIHRLDAGNLNTQFEKSGLYDNQEKIKKFTVHLLNIRLLFDRYVIKHDGIESKDDWRIYTYKWDGKRNDFRNTFDKENTKIIMLQTMFHYSFPAKNYKYWLFAYLKQLNDQSQLQLKDCPKTGKAVILSADENMKFLESLCDKFYFNRFYQNDFSKEYFDIIYNQEVLVLNLSHDDKRCAFLNTGTAVENFIFNRLDYILWRRDTSQEFRFTARNSVEHYYPQNPPNNNPKLGSIDNFGNLCLINHSQNSSLSNKMPSEKKAGYDVKRHPLLSLKQRKMFECGEWLTDEIIQKHGKEMIGLLNKVISE